MTPTDPPKLALRLLQFVSGPARESLVGDLVEQYQSGRSRAWFWRQAVAAVLVTSARDVREHQGVALRALTIGALAYVVLSFPAVTLTTKARVWLTLLLGEGVALFWAGRLTGALMAAFACGTAGWFVGRTHRGAPAMVLLFTLADLVFEYAMVGWLFVNQPRMLTSQPDLIVPFVFLIARPMSILIGGLWGTGSARMAPAPASPDYMLENVEAPPDRRA